MMTFLLCALAFVVGIVVGTVATIHADLKEQGLFDPEWYKYIFKMRNRNE